MAVVAAALPQAAAAGGGGPGVPAGRGVPPASPGVQQQRTKWNVLPAMSVKASLVPRAVVPVGYMCVVGKAAGSPLQQGSCCTGVVVVVVGRAAGSPV